MSIETAKDLMTAIKDGKTVRNKASLAYGTFEVVDVVDEGNERTIRRPGLNDEAGRGYVVIEEETGEEWVMWIMPNRGGPNDGVVAMFWTDEDGGVLGHHEVYPRAFEEA